MKTQAIMQPYFMPYLGYFQLIAAVDKFVFYDDVNYIKRGWINRNYILSNGDKKYLTIPCLGVSQNKWIKDIFIDGTEKNISKIFSSIHHSYAKATYYTLIYPRLEKIFNHNRKSSIAQLNIDLIVFISDYLKLNTVFSVSSKSYPDSQGMDKELRLIEICKQNNVEKYINALGGQSLYNKETFLDNGLSLMFLEPKLEKYTQLSAEFLYGLSILDVIMNEDPIYIRENLLNFKLI